MTKKQKKSSRKRMASRVLGKSRRGLAFDRSQPVRAPMGFFLPVLAGLWGKDSRKQQAKG